MNIRLYFMTAFVFKIAASQNFYHGTISGPGQSVILRCVTVDYGDTILFKLGNANKGGCFTGNICSTGITGYETPTQPGTSITEMKITSCSKTRDAGNWTCTYGGSTSVPVMIIDCSGDTNGSPDDNGDGKDLGISLCTGILVITYIIVIVMVAKRLSIGSTEETSGNCFLTFYQFIEEQFFDCCGNKNNQENPIEECFSPTTTTHVVIEGDPDFFADKVLTFNSLLGFVYLVVYGLFVGAIILFAVYYGYSNFQEGLVVGVGLAILFVLSCLCLVVVWILMKFVTNDASERSRSESCISLKNGTVTPYQRQQPDGHEGPQSTPKDPDARHITTIDTLDEQKTDKKPKDKKKKKKKMKDEEQDTPAYDTEQ